MISPKPAGQFADGHPVHARLSLVRAHPTVRTNEILRVAYLLHQLIRQGSLLPHALNACCCPAAETRVPPVAALVFFFRCCSAFIEIDRLLLAWRPRTRRETD